MFVSVVIVQTIFNQILIEVKKLPDFIETMTMFTQDLETYYKEMDRIQGKTEELIKGTNLTVEQEEELSILENQANEIYVKLIRKKINFQRHWKPSFDMHKDSKKFEKYVSLVTELLYENMLPLSEGLRVVLRSRSEWIKTGKTERLENKIRIMTIILTWVIFSEVFIGCAQIYPQYKELFIIGSIITPILLSIFYYIAIK